MKNILSCTKTALILLVATIILLVASVYMIVRPISYGFGYHNETVYENTVFKGTIKFYPDGTMSVGNANFDEEMMFRYYYKDGYVFSTVAETEEEYEMITQKNTTEVNKVKIKFKIVEILQDIF